MNVDSDDESGVPTLRNAKHAAATSAAADAKKNK